MSRLFKYLLVAICFALLFGLNISGGVVSAADLKGCLNISSGKLKKVGEGAPSKPCKPPKEMEVSIGGDTLSGLACGANQIAKNIGGQWVCAADNNTNAESQCNAGEFLDGNGECFVLGEGGGGGSGSQIFPTGGFFFQDKIYYSSLPGQAITTLNPVAQILIPKDGELSQLTVKILSNSRDADTIFTVLINGSPTALQVTVGPAGSGLQSTDGDIVDVVAGDEVILKIDASASSGAGAMEFLATFEYK